MQLDNVKQQNESVSDWLTQQRSILDEQLDDVKELKVMILTVFILMLIVYSTNFKEKNL